MRCRLKKGVVIAVGRMNRLKDINMYGNIIVGIEEIETGYSKEERGLLIRSYELRNTIYRIYIKHGIGRKPEYVQ